LDGKIDLKRIGRDRWERKSWRKNRTKEKNDWKIY
jgi:hypothetical protein